MLRLSDSRNFSRTLTGLCLIGAPLALTAAAVIGPDFIDDDKQAELNNIAVRHHRFVVSLLLFFVAGILILLAGLGLIRFFRGARVTMGAVAGALLVLGAHATMGFYAISGIEYEMARHGLDQTEMAKLVDQLEDSGILTPVWILFLIGIVIGSILLAIATWRGKTIPVWASAAIVVAAVLGFFGGDDKAFEIAGFVVLLVGLGTLGLTFLRMTDEEWDAGVPPTAGTVPPPAPTTGVAA